ncbi:MAG: EamA family transporter, partial [Planctomycetota bacterium]
LAGRDLGLLPRLDKKDMLFLLLSGVALAAHFFTWISAVQLTTVANAAVFFSINPVITATAGLVFFGERIRPRLLVSILTGVTGIAVMGGADLSFNSEHLAGDGMAVLCSLLFTAYFLIGKRLRKKLPTTTYVTAVYGIAACVAFLCLAGFQLPLFDYSGRTWLCMVLLALVPTMIGHTALNNSLQYIPAGVISTATLTEPLLAGWVAYFAWNETVSVQTGVGYVLISLSVIILVSGEIKVRRSKNRENKESLRI